MTDWLKNVQFGDIAGWVAALAAHGERQSFYEYEWFVSFMLMACDAVLILGPKGGWEGVVKNNL